MTTKKKQGLLVFLIRSTEILARAMATYGRQVFRAEAAADAARAPAQGAVDVAAAVQQVRFPFLLASTERIHQFRIVPRSRRMATLSLAAFTRREPPSPSRILLSLGC